MRARVCVCLRVLFCTSWSKDHILKTSLQHLSQLPTRSQSNTIRGGTVALALSGGAVAMQSFTFASNTVKKLYYAVRMLDLYNSPQTAGAAVGTIR